MTCLNLTCSHDAMVNPVYVPPGALEEVDEKIIEDDIEVTMDKGAPSADPGDAN